MKDTKKIAAIPQHIQELRCDLDEDFHSSFENAQNMMNWRHYIRTYSWFFFNAAIVGGYLIIRRKDSLTHSNTSQCSQATEQNESLAPPKSSPSGIATILRNSVLPLVSNLIMRSVTSDVGKKAGTFFKHLSEESDRRKVSNEKMDWNRHYMHDTAEKS